MEMESSKRETAQGIVLSTEHGEILLTFAGDAVFEAEVIDMTEALDVWENTLGGHYDEWHSALISLDARR
jgi:hypothetical protein